MSTLKIHTDPKAVAKFENYPNEVKSKLEYLRKLIFEVANENEHILEIEETLKWGQPSYLVNKGSTLRIDWKHKVKNQYAMYFKCTSKLVITFKEVFGDIFKYENNRAIVFDLNDTVPEKELKECIRLTLNYHTLKNLPKLGL